MRRFGNEKDKSHNKTDSHNFVNTCGCSSCPNVNFAETIGTESEKFEESGYSTEVSQEEEDPIVIGEDVDRRDSKEHQVF